MTARDAGKLLGGYGTGTLTAEERAALFAAALEDQALFDALADEQALCELLADPAARARLLAALAEAGTAARCRSVVAAPCVGAGGGGGVGGGAGACASAGAGARGADSRGAAGGARSGTARVCASGGSEGAEAGQAGAGEESGSPAAAGPGAAPGAGAQAAPMAEQATLDAVAPSAPQPALPRQENALRMRAMAGETERLASANAAASPQPSLGWTVLAGGEGNRLDAAQHARTVRTGEAFRLEITSAARGWIYVLEPDGSGGWKTAASGAVGPDRPLRFPDAGALRFDEPGLRLWRAAYSPSRPASIPAAPPADALSIAVEVQR